jgi:hypothetical protein
MVSNMMHSIISEDNKEGLNKLIQIEYKQFNDILSSNTNLVTKENEKAFDLDCKIPVNLPVIHDAIL